MRILNVNETVTVADVARFLKVNREQVYRWRRIGVDRDLADRLAGLVGHHPASIWPEIIDHDIDTVTKVCAADDCTATFLNAHPRAHRRFCSARCKARMEWRRRWASVDDEVKERKRAYVRAYKDEVREARLRRLTPKPCEADDCSTLVEDRRRRFCSARCRQRMKMRRHRSRRSEAA
jgi:predicted nucleic acid-binding Zn ribbon protein